MRIHLAQVPKPQQERLLHAQGFCSREDLFVEGLRLYYRERACSSRTYADEHRLAQAWARRYCDLMVRRGRVTRQGQVLVVTTQDSSQLLELLRQLGLRLASEATTRSARLKHNTRLQRHLLRRKSR